MILKGTHKIQAQIEVHPVDVFQSIAEHLRLYLRNEFHEDPEEIYINDEGLWEHWTSYPHGSGTTTTFRTATPDEMLLERSIKTIKQELKEPGRKELYKKFGV